MRKWIAAHRKMVALVVPAVAWGAGITLFISWFIRRTRCSSTRDCGPSLWQVRGTSTPAGNARLPPGVDETSALKFQPAVYDTLEPSGRPTTFRVLEATSSGPRSIERKEAKYVTHRGFQVIRFATDKGDIDVAGRPESLRMILDAVTGSSDFA